MNPEQVLEFWFADATTTPHAAQQRYAFWFRASPEIDTQIRIQFSALASHAQAGTLSAWEAEPRACLALLIALDQFPRNLYRSTPKAFAADPLALAVVQRSLGRAYLPSLSPIERAFFLMPLQHAEILSAQEESVRQFAALTAQVPPAWQEILETFLGSARKHLTIIQQFGRFPHRNVILGRESTPAEHAFLASGSGSFGQAPPGER